MKYDFIEIGLSDFETILQTNCEGMNGVSIEPVSYYLNKLPNKENVKKLNWAISNYNGTIEIFYLKEELINNFGLPLWVRGCNSVNDYHPQVIKLLNQLNIDYKKVVTKETVEVHDIEYLFNFLNVKALNYLKLDCEGHDNIIINNLLNFCEKNIHCRPLHIKFENNSLSNKEEVFSIMKRLENSGYVRVNDTPENAAELEYKLNL